ncbi:hypothetical protein Goarm_018895 [Gossypium armourianum]|uniref:Uncharacterized protein n=1 Tax=Gossypium armourianum TaxID=34283 RepID=A0A7J9IIY8_9ROSI|nr:hypothetical protein [Gossypium armourianum]
MVDVIVNEGILDANNHTAVIFKDNTQHNFSRKTVGSSSTTTRNQLPLVNLRKAKSKLSIQKEGCTNAKFPRVLREYRKQYKSDIVCLLEPKVSRVKANATIASLDLAKSHRVEAVGFSSGIWHSPWLAIGDFNAILSSNDKKGGHVRGRKCSFLFFGDFMDKGKLYDMGFRGPPFTWHQCNLIKRLDQALENEAWNLYGEAPGSICNLPVSAFSQLGYIDIDFLERNVMNKEFKTALFNMAPLKALGSDGERNPIWLSRRGLDLLELFFAKDLVIFSKANLKHCGLLKGFLGNFCEHSRHKVNARKTNIFYFASVKEDLRGEIGKIFGGSLSSPKSKSTQDFLVERSIMVPKGICDSIEKMARQFIWGASKDKSFFLCGHGDEDGLHVLRDCPHTDISMVGSLPKTSQAPIELPKGPMTRARAKLFQEAVSALLIKFWSENQLKDEE